MVIDINSTPSKELQLKRLKYKKAELELMIQKYEIREIEIMDELNKIKINIENVKNSIAQIETEINALTSKEEKNGN